MQTHDEDPREVPELITPEDFLPPSPFPTEARQMGFDRYTGDGAGMLAMAAALNGRKTSHRVFAYALLILVIGSFALTLWGQFHFGR